MTVKHIILLLWMLRIGSLLILLTTYVNPISETKVFSLSDHLIISILVTALGKFQRMHESGNIELEE